MRAAFLTAALTVLLSAPAAAFEGVVAPGYTWSGGPLSGTNASTEPCSLLNSCEDGVLTVPYTGVVTVRWKATSPLGQGWLQAKVWRATQTGARTGLPLNESRATGNEGVITFAANQPGRFVLRMGALLSYSASYTATATAIADGPARAARRAKRGARARR